MAGLPVIMCLKSNNNQKYLRYQSDNIQQYGLLQFSADKILDPLAQFEVEPSKTYDGLVHIKSRYTNKYLVRWSPNHYWITASANEPDENKSNWACTLFKPLYVEEGNMKKVRLLHVQLGHYTENYTVGGSFVSYLFAESSQIDTGSKDVFHVIDWKSIFQFPKTYVTFKGNNGKYLGVITINQLPCLQFGYDNLNDPKVAHQMFVTSNGTICIKSNYMNKFWRLSTDNWILVDGNDPRETNEAAALFRSDVHDFNVISLLNMQKTWFIKRFTSGKPEFINCMNAATQIVDETAILEIIELGSNN
ncbi:unnamed protein product [Amaranthus hypochondriacus]|uniref:Agglutinin n=1 Tax=Amaranthus hypochondriacus TaxID=28502 RepID=Q38719_AMAHP|nr:agglutinin [Amaranthus hypochondriacus]CAA77664.1 seed specific protein of balanced nutritional quality [Amaranthus hypochondriacus]